MKDFWVRYRLTGDVFINVEAETPEEAKEQADKIIVDREFYGIDEIVNIEAYDAEDAKGNKTEFY